MKKVLILLMLLIESVGLFAIQRHLSIAKSWYVPVKNEVPEGFQLTTQREIINDWIDYSVVVPAGTTVVPTYLSADLINFEYSSPDSNSHDLILAVPEDFVEQDQIAQIFKDYQNKAEQIRKPIIRRGIVYGVVCGLCWFIFGGISSLLLLRKQKLRLLFVSQTIVIVVTCLFAIITII